MTNYIILINFTGLCIILKSWRLTGIFIWIGFRAFVLVQVLIYQEKYYILTSQTEYSSTLGYAKLCKNIRLLQQQCKFILTLLLLHLVFYYFFMYSEDERREWMVVCEERETIKKKLIF